MSPRWPEAASSQALQSDGSPVPSGRATKIADSIEAGMISINHHGIALPETPFGGIKDSDFGHQGGIEGLQAYMTAKMVSHMG